MKKKQVWSGGYLTVGDLRSNTVQKLQINVIPLHPKRHGRIKREIFASIFDKVAAAISENFCTCWDSGSSAIPLLEFPVPPDIKYPSGECVRFEYRKVVSSA